MQITDLQCAVAAARYRFGLDRSASFLGRYDDNVPMILGQQCLNVSQLSTISGIDIVRYMHTHAHSLY